MQDMSQHMYILANYSRCYQPRSPRATAWGLELTGAGRGDFRPVCEAAAGGRDAWVAYGLEQPRRLAEYALLYITRGRGCFHSEASGELTVEEGTAVFLFPGLEHYYAPDPRSGWEEYWALFQGALPERLQAEGLLDPSAPRLRLAYGRREVLRRFEEILRLNASTERDYAIQIGVELHALLAELLDRRSDDTRSHEEQMRQARLLLQSSLAGPVDMREVARSLHMSYRNFRRVFREYCGTAPHQYLLELRIARARKMLKESSMNVQEIAGRLGFENPLYFSRLFRKKTGQSPTAWRNSI